MDRIHHRSKTNASWQNFRTQKQIYRDMFNKAKTYALSNKVMECGKDTKKLYNEIVNNILGTNIENLYLPQMTKQIGW